MEKYLEITDTPKRIFAVGDIHGCVDELLVLLNRIEQELEDDDLVIFIGDYIDRGPDSKGVVERLIDFRDRYPATIYLKGNHEDMMLSFLGFEGNLGNSYLHNGADEFLKSYGLSMELRPEEILDLLPRKHLSFYLNLVPYVITSEFVFVHAGLQPLRGLKSQLDQDLFWIRDEFIKNVHRFNKLVIFGHTPYADIYFNPPFKIGIDTGLVYGNKLTCIEPITKKIIQVESGTRQILERQM